MIITRYKGTKIIAKRAKDVIRIILSLMEGDKNDNNNQERN